MKNIIICDIDGTLCSDEHRNHILQQPCQFPGCQSGFLPSLMKCRACNGTGCNRTSKEWDAYFDLCHLDTPIEPVIEVLKAFSRQTLLAPMLSKQYEIHLMTARVDSVAGKTIEWLKKHEVPYDSITFRPADSRVQDNVLKTSWADKLGGPGRVLFVLEDRQRVVDAWRAAGYTCFQVAKGDF